MHNILFDYISQYITLSEEDKRVLESFENFRAVKKGTILLKEGQYSNEGYFVLKGCLRTFYVIDGEEKTTAFYTEMEGLTPPCTINKKPSEYFVSTVEDSIITVSTPDRDSEIFDQFPRFEKICRVISEQIIAKNQSSFDEFKTSSPEQRYLSLLKNRPDLLRRVPQYQLASYLGITPQSLSRMRGRIAEKKK